MLKNRFIALLFRSILTILLGIGLIGHIFFEPDSSPSTMLCFFTIQSNILCFVCMMLCFFSTVKSIKYDGKYGCIDSHVFLKSCATLAITVTFLVYHFLLRPTDFFMSVTQLQRHVIFSFILHYVGPIMFILDWILFDEKGLYKSFYPLAWLAFPLFYVGFAFIRGYLFEPIFPSKNGKLHPFPYFFLDPSRIGWNGVLTWVAILLVIFLIIGYLYLIIDKILGKRKNKKYSFKLSTNLR